MTLARKKSTAGTKNGNFLKITFTISCRLVLLMWLYEYFLL